MTAAFKRPHDDDQHQDSPPAKKAKENDEDICVICLDAINGQPSIALACTHVYHTACLEMAVTKAVTEAVDTEYVDQYGNALWRVQAPRCPMCRTRFRVAGYWPQLADADNYPDDGLEFAVDPNLQGEVEVELEFDTNAGGNDDNHSGTDSHETSSDSEEDAANNAVPAHAADGGWVCSQCNQHSTHTEQSANDFMQGTAIDNPSCFICTVAILQTDIDPVLSCDNCGAPSHYHD